MFSLFTSFLNVLLRIFGFLAKVVAVFIAVLAGNFLGDRLRNQITGEAGHQMEFIHQDEHGNTFIAANLLISNFLPGLFFGLIARPRIIFAFLGGIVASFFLADRYEDALWETLDEVLSGGDPTRDWIQPVLHSEPKVQN